MRLSTRKIISSSTTAVGIFAFCIMGGAILIILGPLIFRGAQAFIFQDTIERRRFRLEDSDYHCRAPEKVKEQIAEVKEARQPVYELLNKYGEKIKPAEFKKRRKLKEVKDLIRPVLGPFPDESERASLAKNYGTPRWQQCREKVHELLYRTEYRYPEDGGFGENVYVPRKDKYEEEAELYKVFELFEDEDNLRAMMQPRWRFYWRFLFENPKAAYHFGGIWPAVVGTVYLSLGAMLIAGPVGVISAIYLTQYARRGPVIGLLRTCISTLAGVPSVVFGLFGLGFFIYQLNLGGGGRSVFIGAMTLAILVLPTVIRASEEALLAVPRSYLEGSAALGDTKWGSIVKVILPSAMPGIITSSIISVGRAAGETAPILFTAAVISSGSAVGLSGIFTKPTQALPASIYSLVSEHGSVEEIMHIPYGMVFTLVMLVISLNLVGIILRARISKKLKGQ